MLRAQARKADTMKWEGRRKSTKVNDQRGSSYSSGRRVAMGGGGLGIVGIVVYLLISMLGGGGGGPGTGTDITDILGDVLQPGPAQQQQESTYTESEQEKQLMGMLSVALADIEDTWSAILPKSPYRTQYAPPQMTIYTGHVNTACGAADAGMGPFYCPGDKTIYLDLSFYNTLTQKYGAKEGDYAMVYVIAHEAGHHVQTLLGVTQQLNALRQRVA